MNELIKKVTGLKSTKISQEIGRKLEEFSSFKSRSDDEWFSELCFCILTANSKAITAIKLQKIIGTSGFLRMPQEKLAETIKSVGHRFHNNKARFIVCARKFRKIKKILSKEKNPRGFLVKNVKGLGQKEASHFLRNTGHFDFSIIDRHIVNLLYEHGLYPERYEGFRAKEYLRVEDSLRILADKTRTSLGELDLYLWFIKTGHVLK